jgi:hypothetical protein
MRVQPGEHDRPISVAHKLMLLAGCLGAGALAGFVGAEIAEGQSVSSRVLACEEVVRESEGQALSAQEIAPCDGLQLVSERIETHRATDADIRLGGDPSELDVTYRLVESEVFDEIIAQRAAMLEDTERQQRNRLILGGLGLGFAPAFFAGLYVAGRRQLHLESSRKDDRSQEAGLSAQPTIARRKPAGQGGA